MKTLKGKMTPFDYFNYILLCIISLLTIYPFWHIAAISVTSAREYLTKKFLIIPTEINFNAYAYIFSEKTIMNGFFISMVRVAGSIIIGIVITALMAYPLTVKTLRGSRFFFILILIPMLFSGGLIPYYLLLKDLNMINKIWVLIIPGCVSTMNIILMRNYMASIPESLAESAKLDGANDLTVLYRIILPLSGPIIAVLCLYTGVGVWNDFFTGMIYISSRKLMPLANILRSMLVDNDLDYAGKVAVRNEAFMLDVSIKMAAVVVSIIPVLAAYPLLQKYFVKGIMLGSVKG